MTFSDKALEYFARHRIQPSIAQEVGVEEAGDNIVYPRGRRRSLRPGGHTVQPSGQPLKVWWPRGRQPSEAVLLCEGESDGLSAESHRPGIPSEAGLPPLSVVAVPGTGFPVQRLVDELEQAGASQVFLAFDGDQAGRGFAQRATEPLRAAGIRPCVVDLPDGSDLADCLAGADDPGAWLANALVDAEAAAEEAADVVAAQNSSWSPVDLTPALDGREAENQPAFLVREDGVHLLYERKLHTFFAEPESAKGWLALQACVELISDGRHVLYIDFEDSETTLVGRLLALGCTHDQIAECVTYIRPDEPLTDSAKADLDAAIAHGPALVVIDGVTEALTIFGLDLNDNSDSARFYEQLPRPMVRAGAAVFLIDHVAKDRDGRGRFAIGAQHKLAGVDVAYSLEVVEPFGRGRDGVVKVTVVKDRPGHVRQYADERNRIAEMKLSSDAESGEVTISLAPPGDATAWRPTFLMGRISEAIAAEPGMTTRGIREGVPGNNAAKQVALRLLIADRYVDRVQDGQANRHYSLRPFTEDGAPDDTVPTAPRPRPDRAQAHPGHSVPRAPAPIGGTARGTDDGEPRDRVQPCPPLEILPLSPSCVCPRPASTPRPWGRECDKCKKPVEVAA